MELAGNPPLAGYMKWAFVFSTVAMLGLIPTPWFLEGVTVTSRIEEHPGDLFALFVVYFIWWTGYGLSRVVLAFRSSQGILRNKLKYAVLFYLLLFSAAVLYFVHVTVPDFPPVFYVSEIMGNAILAYAIVRHRILDITLAYRYGTIYTILSITLGAPLALFVGWWSKSVGIGLVSFLAPVAGHLLATRLMPGLTRAIDRLPLFRGKYESYHDLKTRESSLRASDSLEDWKTRLTEGIRHVLKPRTMTLMMTELELQPLGPDSPLSRALQKGQVVLRNYLEDTLRPEDVLSSRVLMENMGAEILAPLTNGDGTLAAVIAIGQKHDRNIWNDLDLTALWSLTRVAEETLRIIMTRDDLLKKERLAMVGEMAAMVSHELKTPLAVIQNSTFILRGRLKEATDPKLTKYLNVIESQAASLGTIIGGILSYTRNRELMLEKCDVNGLIQGWMEVIPMPENIRVGCEWGPNIPPVLLDPEEIKQAVTNLVNNAVQSMPEGGGLTIRTTHGQGRLSIQVKDTGKGMPEEEQKRIFEPFFTTKSGGTGLGLAVVKKVMARHEGGILIESRVGEGTSVTLSIPIKS
jgi:signal transduction histidine kinase